MRISTLLPVFFATATIAAVPASPYTWEVMWYPASKHGECKSANSKGEPLPEAIYKADHPKKCTRTAIGWGDVKFTGFSKYWDVTFYKTFDNTTRGCVDPIPEKEVKKGCVHKAAAYKVEKK